MVKRLALKKKKKKVKFGLERVGPLMCFGLEVNKWFQVPWKLNKIINLEVIPTSACRN